MTLREQAEAKILEIVPYYRQTNAALTGEYKEFIQLALTILRDYYHHLESQGATEFVIEPEIMNWINENKPY